MKQLDQMLTAIANEQLGISTLKPRMSDALDFAKKVQRDWARTLPAERARILRAFESERPLGDFDVIALSISFETDYLHVLDILALAGLPLRREARPDG